MPWLATGPSSVRPCPIEERATPDGPSGPARYRPAAALGYDNTAAALRAAEVAALSRQPARVVSAEWRELSDLLAVSPALSQRDNAATAVGVVRERVRQQETNVARTESLVESLQTAHPRRRNPQGIELARREAALARQGLANAEATLAAAQDRVAAAEAGTAAQEPALARRRVLDAALEAKTAAAVASPAPYLVDAIGPRPEAPADPTRWEAVRHVSSPTATANSGSSPTTGPPAKATRSPPPSGKRRRTTPSPCSGARLPPPSTRWPCSRRRCRNSASTSEPEAGARVKGAAVLAALRSSQPCGLTALTRAPTPGKGSRMSP